MSINIPTHYAEEFKGNLAMLLQQKMSRFRMAVTEAQYFGEGGAAVDQFGAVTAREVTSRFEPIGRVDAATDRRWVYPTPIDLPQYIDTADKLKLVTDPEGIYVRNARAGLNRKIDDIIIAGLSGNNATGKQGGTTTSFDTTNSRVAVTVGAAAATGMNVEKLKNGRKILNGNEAFDDDDEEPLFLALAAHQEDELLGEVQVTSAEYSYRQRPVLIDGKLRYFMGCTMLHSERLAVTSDPYRRCLMWVKSGGHLGTWNEIESFIGPDMTLKLHPIQVYCWGMFGACRTEEKKVIDILCDES
jgi:hypothetical protein